MELVGPLDFIDLLCLKTRELSSTYKNRFTINLHISPFVPKPWTPFQWIGMEPIKILENKLKKIQIHPRKNARLVN